MSGSIAKAYVQIIPSAEGIKGKLSGVFNNEMPSAGKNAGGVFGSNLVSKIKGLIAAAGIGKLLADSIMSGADLEQSLGGIETLFKDSADVVIKNAEQAYKTAGMSANQYMEMVTGFSASLLQGLSGDTEKAASVADMALTDMSDNANKMGTSMELIQNAYQGFAKQNYTMLDNLKLGYGGTKTEMQRLLADAEKLTGVKYDLNNLADVYEAIHVIQEEMGITGTTAKEASETLSGSFASMKAAFSDFMANLALGRNLESSLEALTETAFTFLVGNLLPAVGNILAGLPTVFSTAFSAAIRGLNIAANNADAILQHGVDLVVSIGSAIITALPYLAESAVKFAAALGKAVLETDWVQLGQGVIADIRNSLDIAAGEILGTDGNIVKSILDAVSNGLPSILESGIGIVVEMANGFMAAIPGFMVTVGDMMNQLLGRVLSMLPDLLASGISLVGQLSAGLLSSIPFVLESAAMIVEGLLSTILGHLPDLLGSGMALILEFANGLIARLPDVIGSATNILAGLLAAITGYLPDLLAQGISLISELAIGLLSSLPTVIDSAISILDGLLSTMDRFLPDLLSTGIALIRELASGLITNLPAVISAAGRILGQILATIASRLPDLLASGISLIGQLVSGLISMIPEVVAAIPKIISGIVDTFKKWDWGDIGKNIAKGVAKGISSAASAIWDAAKQAAKAALNAAKKALGIASPSKVMRDEVGKFIPSGLAVGIENNTKPLTDAMHDLSVLTTDTMNAELNLDGISVGTASTGHIYGDNHVTINVYAAENQDVEELAEILMNRIQFAVSQREVSFAR